MDNCNAIACPHCDLLYDDMRTGYTFTEIRAMLWTDNDDPTTWRYKRRHSVLGLWHQIKGEQWAEHLRDCEKASGEPVSTHVMPVIINEY